MAGHSKWSQIKRDKASNDSKRGAIFSKMAREIYVATREAGPNPALNMRLRIAMERSKREGMSGDTIECAILKGSGGGPDAGEYQTVIYEGYGSGGVAVMAVALTENRNRTAAEVRGAFNRHGGTLGETGTVGWQFDTIGQIVVQAAGKDADDISMTAIDAGAADVVVEGDEVIVTTEPSDMSEVADALRAGGLDVVDQTVTRVPQNTVDVDPRHLATVVRLLEALEELDDVQDVFTNASFSEDPAEVEAVV